MVLSEINYMKRQLLQVLQDKTDLILQFFLKDYGAFVKRTSLINTNRIDHLYQNPFEKQRKFILHHADLTDSTLTRIILEVQPAKFTI